MDPNSEKILSSIFLKYAPIKSSSLELLIGSCELKDVKKGDRLASEGKPESYEYFFLESLACRFVFDQEGEVVVAGFYLPKSVATPHFARTVNGKSIYNLEILADGSIARIPVKILDSLRNSYEDIRTFGLKVLESELTKTLQAEVAYRAMTAKDRLLIFREQYPNLENLIPHSFIASYLGVTPVSFSRLRNELAKG